MYIGMRLAEKKVAILWISDKLAVQKSIYDKWLQTNNLYLTTYMPESHVITHECLLGNEVTTIMDFRELITEVF